MKDRAISLNAVIDALHQSINLFEAEDRIRDLPNVKPQYTDDEIQAMQDLEQAEIQKAYELGKPKTGHWKRISMDKYTEHAQHWYECDKCGEHNLGDTNFCPYCGADMRGEQDG